ncbi:hypothetical protein PANT111_160226 [Pantoea brenneri]|uniref:Uncharacterized protein n=1 Tax=Pantoea brenneri TaxID=472694 RepID=A0AAX3J4L7_9GAMM|nr:hypothetical protein PANT111_160226 [Pantoea brenneri]
MLKHNKICTLKLIFISLALKIKQAKPLRFAYNYTQIIQ